MFRNILVPIDGSPLSAKPLDSALEFAKANHGKIVALSVSEPRVFYSSDPDASKHGDVHEDANLQKAQLHLQKVAETARNADVACETVIVQSRTPGEEIIDVANHYGCDAIFMATRGSFGVIEKLFNESQTHKVLEGASVPVVVFP
ncbi:universal stress protein [Oxalobacteraceae bacterium R-40]|uniref:Universal stress protein n=1 Tax=Keguizhuia sedimenti TaxID=3064264 RepID=A0ABU1BUU0_9BURK|nr:universal stress protein [Oxalobacteraceae bacterium R-40]